MHHWLNFSIGSSACHMAVSQILKRNELYVEIYINEDKELFSFLLQNKDAIESETGICFDWRELPDRKASRIIAIKKNVSFNDNSKWTEQFNWIMDVMTKVKTSFKKYI